MNIAQTYSVDNVTKKFKNLKEYYEIHLQDWYNASIQQLKEEKEKAIVAKERAFQKKIEAEIFKRTEMLENQKRYIENIKNINTVNLNQVYGTYEIVGNNPRNNDKSYYGELILTGDNDVIRATWKFKSFKQDYSGIGVRISNNIAIAFEYEYAAGASGVIIYEIITPEVLRGKWTIFGINSCGTEECRKRID